MGIDNRQILIELSDDRVLRFDTLYPALGSSPQTQLALQVGAAVAGSGGIVTDADQQTSVPRLFAAGDVVEGLDQISVATGHAATATTAIHNLLRERDAAASLTRAKSAAQFATAPEVTNDA